MAIYCYNNGRWKYGSVQLIKGEDYGIKGEEYVIG